MSGNTTRSRDKLILNYRGLYLFWNADVNVALDSWAIVSNW